MLEMEIPQDPRIEAYWRSFIQAASLELDPASARYQAWSFGNTADMADRLGDLVRRGVKTATASLVWAYEADQEPIPKVGEYSIILDGRGLPMCIIQTTELKVVPFDKVGEQHAYLEGEGDRSLRYWKQVHWKFFEEECRQIGRKPSAQMPVLCEKFILIHK